MDERLLVKRAKRGDTAAFAELYGTIYKRLYQFALYTLGNTQDAEDVVSAAVMEAFENIGKLRKEDAFSAWKLPESCSQYQVSPVLQSPQATCPGQKITQHL